MKIHLAGVLPHGVHVHGAGQEHDDGYEDCNSRAFCRAVTYLLVEQPFLRLRDRQSPWHLIYRIEI